MKTVIIFRGKEYKAPAKSKYLAIDDGGLVFLYAKKPKRFEIRDMWINRRHDTTMAFYLCTVKPPKHPEQELYKLEAV